MGGGSKRPKVVVPEEPAPAPQPILAREQEEAKKKVKKRARRGGRESTVFAGRLNAQRNDTSILNTRLG